MTEVQLNPCEKCGKMPKIGEVDSDFPGYPCKTGVICTCGNKQRTVARWNKANPPSVDNRMYLGNRKTGAKVVLATLSGGVWQVAEGIQNDIVDFLRINQADFSITYDKKLEAPDQEKKEKA